MTLVWKLGYTIIIWIQNWPNTPFELMQFCVFRTMDQVIGYILEIGLCHFAWQSFDQVRALRGWDNDVEKVTGCCGDFLQVKFRACSHLHNCPRDVLIASILELAPFQYMTFQRPLSLRWCIGYKLKFLLWLRNRSNKVTSKEHNSVSFTVTYDTWCLISSPVQFGTLL